MEIYIFQALLGAVFFAASGMLFKWNAHSQGDDAYFLFGLYLIGSICFFINGYDGLSEINQSAFIICALLIGLGSAGGNYLFSKALRLGPASLTTAFAKSNILIVIFLSAFYYKERILIPEMLGLFCFLSAMFVINFKKRADRKAADSKWFIILLFCIILLSFRNGGLKVVDELQLNSALVGWLSYLLCALFFAGLIAVKKKNMSISQSPNSTALLKGSVTGILSYAGLMAYIAALKNGPASIVVTIFSLDMIFVLLMSYFLFGERLTRNQKIGFILSAIGFLFLSIK